MINHQINTNLTYYYQKLQQYLGNIKKHWNKHKHIQQQCFILVIWLLMFVMRCVSCGFDLSHA